MGRSSVKKSAKRSSSKSESTLAKKSDGKSKAARSLKLDVIAANDENAIEVDTSEDEWSEFEDEASDDSRDMESTSSSKLKTADRKIQFAENYFAAQSCKTSKKTRKGISEVIKIDATNIRNELENVPDRFAEQKKAIADKHQQMFDEWMLYMMSEFNIMTYGFGSKINLLQSFRQKFLSDCVVLEVNGFFPDLTVRDVLQSITVDILESAESIRNPNDQLAFIAASLADRSKAVSHVFVIVHSMDGPPLRQEKCQDILAKLAAIKGIHLLASCDHVNSHLLWDKEKQSKLNFLWLDVTNYEPYILETSYENSLLAQRSNAVVLSSMTSVFQSLTANAKGIFILLLKYQLEHSAQQGYLGMSFLDLYRHCRESFLVNSDLTLRGQLTEFQDHKLLKSKKGPDGTEYLLIPLESDVLTEFTDIYEKGF